MDPTRERTLLLIKPDAVQRGLIGEILARVERAGLAIVALHMRHVSHDFARGHYATSEGQLAQMGRKTLDAFSAQDLDVTNEFGTDDPSELGRMIHEWNCEFLSSGPVAAAVIDGYHAIKKLRALCGVTMPLLAAPGTIRGDLGSVSALVASLRRAAVPNLVHASDNELDPDEPNREIEYWFSGDGIYDATRSSWPALAGAPYH